MGLWCMTHPLSPKWNEYNLFLFLSLNMGFPLLQGALQMGVIYCHLAESGEDASLKRGVVVQRSVDLHAA